MCKLRVPISTQHQHDRIFYLLCTVQKTETVMEMETETVTEMETETMPETVMETVRDSRIPSSSSVDRN